jgi:drug/metabolite transporter (DMT)-like permease
MFNQYVGAIIISVFLSAISQVLLKKSSGEKKKNIIFEYLNVKVIVAYLIYIVTALLAVYAFTGIEFRLGTILTTLTYFLFMLCGRIFFKEKITPRRIIGNCVIIAGIVVFTLNM